MCICVIDLFGENGSARLLPMSKTAIHFHISSHDCTLVAYNIVECFENCIFLFFFFAKEGEFSTLELRVWFSVFRSRDSHCSLRKAHWLKISVTVISYLWLDINIVNVREGRKLLLHLSHPLVFAPLLQFPFNYRLILLVVIGK